jgi:type II secretory ATPase GspE/PulE/Tfp pilus assembly ATPase PilB-like protein/FixJ family two-component response regulator
MNATTRPDAHRAVLRFLQREGRLEDEVVARLHDRIQRDQASIFDLLEAEGLVRDVELAELLASTLRLRLVDLNSFALEPQVVRILKETVALKYQVVPLALGEGTVEIATANPLDMEAVKAVEFATGRRVQLCVATCADVREALAHAYRMQESLEEFLQNVPEGPSVTVTELHDDGSDLHALTVDTELPPVVKLADLVLIEGIKGKASDVHVEPTADAVVIRYRIDGLLEEAFRFPKWVQNPLVGRFKVMAKLDITERRVPQDGRMQIKFKQRAVDLRISSLPTHLGEKLTMRVLDASGDVRSLDGLGLGAADLARMREVCRHPEGMILVTGPTGSGKSTTLYALLRELHSPTRNIVTIENPIEYYLKGINQVDVNDKQGLTFASVLRSVLRQDPDVILVGEIRDRETAVVAFQAAQTGHLVLSTLHTNDAAATLTRLVDLGIEPFVVASTVHLVVAQRLVRKVCPACAVSAEASDEQLRLLHLEREGLSLRRGAGCPACRQSGYSGRVGVYEVLPISPTIGTLIEGGGGESAIRRQARSEGCRLLIDDAREKVRAAITTPDEVLRVIRLNEGQAYCPSCKMEVADDYAVCPRCATRLQAKCQKCEKPLAAGWSACPYCGANVEGRESVGGMGLAAERTFKALVVDDEAAIRHIERLMLEEAGLRLAVVTAQDGAEALALAALERPDVVVLDLGMPDMDGIEVCRRLRADSSTAFVPVIMVTAYGDLERRAAAFEAGVDDYIVKPFERRDLVARIRRMLERTYGRDAVAAESEAGSRKP